MSDPVKLMKQILALGESAAPVLVTLIDYVSKEPNETKRRVILVAALRAAEEAVLKASFPDD